MSYVVFLLSLLLLGAGAFSAYLSLDLLPTGPGLLYAFSGAVAAVGAVVVLALGLLIRRVDRLGRLVQASTVVAASEARLPSYAAPAEAPAAETVPLDVEADLLAGPLTEPTPEEMQPLGAEDTEAEGGDEDALNENRAGHLPTLAEIEHAIETPEAPPTLIGRYSSGGANYMIFADGSIEAETNDGTFKFPSMGDFKQYLAERREAKS
jgi:hypothetical protein